MEEAEGVQIVNGRVVLTGAVAKKSDKPAQADPAVGVVIVTGSGEKAFVAGADIGELARQTVLGGKEKSLRGQKVLNLIENLGKPVIAATAGCRRPRWAKLSANTDRIIEVAQAVVAAGAEAVTCINTLLGLAYDAHTLAPTLGAGGGGLSGRAIHPVAVRAVHDVHVALPDVPIIGVGGVASAWDAVELLLAGASAVQVGTASFADPGAACSIQDGLIAWAQQRGLPRLADISALA